MKPEEILEKWVKSLQFQTDGCTPLLPTKPELIGLIKLAQAEERKSNNKTLKEALGSTLEEVKAIEEKYRGEGRKEALKEERKWLLNILHDLCFCDHMGDVSNTMIDIQRRLGLAVEWQEFSELADAIEAIRKEGEE